MPIHNLGKIHFTHEQINSIHDSLNAVWDTITAMAVNLSPEERNRLGKVADKKGLLIDKVKDYKESSPRLLSPEVDWEEFDKDYNDRYQIRSILSKMQTVERVLHDIKILRDFDNYTDSLLDYKYAQYKNRFADEAGYENKIEEIKQFFPKTGKKKAPKKDNE